MYLSNCRWEYGLQLQPKLSDEISEHCCVKRAAEAPGKHVAFHSSSSQERRCPLGRVTCVVCPSFVGGFRETAGKSVDPMRSREREEECDLLVVTLLF